MTTSTYPIRQTAAVLAVVFVLVLSPAVGPLSLAGSATAASGDVLYRVNAGGQSVPATSGSDWIADASGSQYSSGGSDYSGGLSASEITNPTDAPTEVFASERYGDHSWSFDVTSGESYEVRLYFAEIFHAPGAPGEGDDEGGDGEVGDRVFDVSIEGQQVLDDYDIVADVGAGTGTVKTFEATPTDGTLDVSFTTEVDNAKISAIEVVEAAPSPGVLSGPSTVDFGTTIVDDTTTKTVTLSNEGENATDASITVSDVSLTGADAGDFSTDFSGSTTLAPGETLDVAVTFSPSDAQSKSATVEVSHDAPNTTSPLTVGLSGEGQSKTAVGFGAKDTVTSQVNSPTSIEFGPDDRLYVSERFGPIKVFEVTRTGEDAYDATLVETIDAVENIPNHDDQGNYESGVTSRQVTGLTVAGTADQPVLYVTSSDPRVGGGGGGEDKELDTNSGVVSRLTLESDGSWDHDMVVRGLPRSEENHANNGLQYYTENGNEFLLVAVGGHTNQGAPSNNFAYTPEYALSAAILEVNLTKLNADNTLQAAANTDAQYLYDLPTLQGTATPFGGQDGENMAKLVEGDGISIFSAGYRNPYDVERTLDGQVYTVDNGPNGGWGGEPVNEGTDPVCTNEPNENPSESNSDNLHYVTEGFYGGHPNPTRANPDGAGIWEETAPENDPQQIGSTAGAVYDGYDGAVECDYRPSGEGDGALWTNGASTNGMDEYTASNFEGGMQGDLLTAAFDGNVYRIQLTSDGTDVSTEPNAQFSPGNTPLDVDAVGDDGPFPGTVFVAEFGGAISAYEPNDYDGSGGGDTCTGADDASLDEDGDGYDNADEIDAGSDPCSASSTPPDYDDDGTSNLNDPDDDNDGIDDVADEFPVDPDNGLTTTTPVEYDFVRASQPDSLEGIGFTGLMLPEDGSTDYQDLYVPGDTVFGGANPALTVEAVKAGDATQNNQQHAYQFGVDTPDEPFVVDTTVTGFTDDPDSFESAGLFVGTGDQDNYRKLTVNGFGGGTSGEYGVQLFGETGGTNLDVANANVSDSFGGSGTTTRLELVVDPTTDPAPDNGVAEVNVTGFYTIDDGPRTQLASTAMPEAWLTNPDKGLAVGVISTSYQGDEQFSVTWNDLNVTTVAGQQNSAPVADAGADQTVTEGSTVTLDATGSSDPDDDQLGYSWTQTAGPDVDFDVQDVPDPSFTAPTVESETTLTFEVTVSDGLASDTDTVNVTVQPESTEETVFAVNAGGPEYTAGDGTVYTASADTGVFTGGSQFAVGDTQEIGNTTDDPLYRSELYGGDTSNAAPNLTIPVQDGTYAVTLQFAELFQDSSGQRVFDVTVEGEKRLDDFDIYAQVGKFNATDRTYTATVTDGELNVNFTAEADNAKIGAVKVVRVGDAPSPTTSADVTVNDGAGIEASTFSSGSFSVTNTGETNLSTVQIDVSESAVPDAVFDPNGTAGDQTAKGVEIDSQSGDGVDVVTTDSWKVFSQPHNGVDDAEGYDVLTLEFTDFEPGETVTFSTDLDPTTIKGASTTGGAGSVSGLELSGSAVTVASAEGTAANDLFTDGSAGGAQSNVTTAAPAAPTLGVDGVTLGATDFPAHEAATVTEGTQTLTISGPADATVELLTVEASPPPSDGYDLDAYEADSAEVVSSQPVTLDANGEATVQVTLSETNLNYFQASVQDGAGSTGAVSQTVALDYDPDATEPGAVSADVTLTPNSGLAASTYSAGSYTVTNSGEEPITTLRVDLNETLLPDMVFDPFNTAGDNVGKEFTLDSGDVTVENVEYTNFHNGENNSAGYDSLVVTLSGFEPGESMAFSIDNDPTSISSTDLGSQAAGPVSGLELTGGTVSVAGDGTPTETATIVGDGSDGGAEATVQNDTSESPPTLDVDGVSLSATTLSDRHSAATVTEASQTVTVTGAPANSEVTVLRVEGELNLSNVPDPYEIEAFEANKAVNVSYTTTTTDANGDATVDVTLSNSTPEGGDNYLVAFVVEPDGDTGPTSDYVVLELQEETVNTPPTLGSITDTGVAEGDSVTVDVPAADADGDDLTVTAEGPAFVTVDETNLTVTAAPGDDTVGTYPVTVTVSDGQASVSEEFAVYVDEPDQDGEVVFAVNAGGSDYTATDGTTYVADTNFTGGTTFSTGDGGTPSDPEIGNTDDDTLYQTERYGDPFGYDVGVENGTYEVTLQFAEIYQGVSSNDDPGGSDGTNEDDRLFSASIEGQQVLSTYDIFSEVGPLNATSKTYTVEVTDGELNLDFAATNDNAKISAIRIERLDTGPGPVGDFENAPTDPDGDGVYEDVNGDGALTGADVTAFFNAVSAGDDAVQADPAAFDFNGDGGVSSADVTALFAEVTNTT